MIKLAILVIFVIINKLHEKAKNKMLHLSISQYLMTLSGVNIPSQGAQEVTWMCLYLVKRFVFHAQVSRTRVLVK